MLRFIKKSWLTILVSLCLVYLLGSWVYTVVSIEHYKLDINTILMLREREQYTDGPSDYVKIEFKDIVE